MAKVSFYPFFLVKSAVLLNSDSLCFYVRLTHHCDTADKKRGERKKKNAQVSAVFHSIAAQLLSLPISFTLIKWPRIGHRWQRPVHSKHAANVLSTLHSVQRITSDLEFTTTKDQTTGGQKTCQFTFVHIFVKNQPIFKILLLVHSVDN